MSTINLVLPHQLFKNSPLLELEGTFYLIEEYLFFKQYPFHKQKIAFHRATMKGYADYLASKGFEVIYIEAHELLADIRQLIPLLKAEGISQINCIDPTDNWISKRIEEGCKKTSISLKILDSPLFLIRKNTTKRVSTLMNVKDAPF
jgi:deoxyribodipyrimidine photolyase-related protein